MKSKIVQNALASSQGGLERNQIHSVGTVGTFSLASSAQLSQPSEDNLDIHSDPISVHLFCLNTVRWDSLWTLSILSLSP